MKKELGVGAAVLIGCSLALVLCVVTRLSSSNDDATVLDIVDPALVRLSKDRWFTEVTDTALTQAAEEVARTRLETIILSRVHHMTHGQPAELDKVIRVAEERVIYDKRIVHQVKREIEDAISPKPPAYELPTIRALEEKLKTRMMHSLTKEAVREINLLVDATNESPQMKEMTKDHLLERTTDILIPQVEGRIRRFIQSRVSDAAEKGLDQVLQYLAHSVDTEEQRELLGGPLVPGLDYSFRQEEPKKQVVTRKSVLTGDDNSMNNAAASISTTIQKSPASKLSVSGFMVFFIFVISALILMQQ